jgi:hypothetical protein
LSALVLAGAIATPAPSRVVTAPRPLASATTASEGLSAERLARMHARLDKFVEDGQVAGAVSLVVRRGRIVDVHTTGLRDLEQRLPMTRDTIVRIDSMTKIVTSVAALMLVEEGRLHDQRPERAVAAGDAGLDGLWPRDVGEDCGDSARQALAVQSAGHVHGILDHGERRDRVRQPFPM